MILYKYANLHGGIQVFKCSYSIFRVRKEDEQGGGGGYFWMEVFI